MTPFGPSSVAVGGGGPAGSVGKKTRKLCVEETFAAPEASLNEPARKSTLTVLSTRPVVSAPVNV